MPKIEINKDNFFKLLGKQYSIDELETLLTFAKAELDVSPTEFENSENIKIELNDTNRPDLWTENGLSRPLNILHDKQKSNKSVYDSFLSLKDAKKDLPKIVINSKVKKVRPYIAGFLVKGKKITDKELHNIIQTQEKLCTNYGKKRQTLAMGIYKANMISWPISYTTESPSFEFTPLNFEQPTSLNEILKTHPKGIEYAGILKDFKEYPILKDAKGEVLSFPPIINSAKIGAVEKDDDFLFVEFTGTQLNNVLLACNIVACDFSDNGWEVAPILVEDAQNELVTPMYFQEPCNVKIDYINKLLGSSFSMKEIILALEKMDSNVRILDENTIQVLIAPYRNDYLHPVDVVEDVMIANGLSSFEATPPNDFTIGRLLPQTVLGRKIKKLLVGMGYEEFIFNYLGSKQDYIEKMQLPSDNVLEILNPISENYQFVRPSILPSLLSCESSSSTATYPHKIFELGKIAYISKNGENGTKTSNSLCFLTAEKEANYNKIASEVSAFFYYLNLDYKVTESSDSRFILGRVATCTIEGKEVGTFGELSPNILENWEITMPCVIAEFDIDLISSFIK
ncbi:MAG: phenylalanine--tRNA ligase subunit beta [Treponema sp.]